MARISTFFSRFLLIVVAAALVALAASSWFSSPAPSLLAQTSPIDTATPTETPTETPTINLTPTITDTTPTATPTKSRRVVNEMTHPQDGDAISGITDILGTALLRGFLKYEVSISPTGLESWQWLKTNYEIVREDIVYQLDTTKLPDGAYDIRVRAVDSVGGYQDAFLRDLEIRNALPPTATPVVNVEGTPIFALQSPLDTPTPMPDTSVRVPGGQGFYGPNSGDSLKGAVSIDATVNGTVDKVFSRYELFLSPAGSEDWVWLDGSDRQVWQKPIYVFDTTRFPDGAYDMRLRIVFRDGNYNEYHLRNLQIANRDADGQIQLPQPAITSPRNGASVDGVIEVVGITNVPDFLRWELYYSPSGLDEWSFLVSEEYPTAGGLLARVDLSQLPAGNYDLRLRVVRNDYNYSEHFVRGLAFVPPFAPAISP